MTAEPETGRSADNGIGATADSGPGTFLARAFWVVACADILLAMAAILAVRNGVPYGAAFELFLLGFLVILGAISGIAAFIRKGAAYLVGLLLLVWPLLYLLMFVGGAVVQAFY